MVGLLLLAFTATSALPTGLVSSVTIGVHVTVDLVLAVLLVALPFSSASRRERPDGVVHRRRRAPPARDDRHPLLPADDDLDEPYDLDDPPETRAA